MDVSAKIVILLNKRDLYSYQFYMHIFVGTDLKLVKPK